MVQVSTSKPQAAVTPIKVLYHSISDGMHCDDGFCAAWIAWNYYKDIECLDSVEFIPAIYGKDPDMMKLVDSNVFILDFSYSRQKIMEIASIAKNLTVLDHHKTAQKELEGIPGCIFDMNRSGAMIAWDFFHSGTGEVRETPPTLVQIVQDNDLWKHQIPNCQELVRWIRSFPQNFHAWNRMNLELTLNYDKCIDEAKAIERYYQQQLEAQMGLAVPIKFGDLTGRIVNCGKQYASDICHQLQNKLICDVASSYFIRPDGKAEISLRSEWIDVSAIAKGYGGGGHAKAAGFSMYGPHLLECIDRGYI